jgi:hypothetical protein
MPLDFDRPFMPEGLARVEALDALSAAGKRTLNQIRGYGYVCMFGLVEEFILPSARSMVHRAGAGSPASREIAAAEARHVAIFRRFREELEHETPMPCRFIGPPAEIAGAVLARDPLAVGLVLLQVEWMTQRHSVEAVRDERVLDPHFRCLLGLHWQEEARLARRDAPVVVGLARGRTEASIQAAVDDYLEIATMLDAALTQQAALDLDCFERATGCALTADEAEGVTQAQHQAQRWTYLGSGMTHPSFLETLEALSPHACRRIEDVAPSFC